MLKIYTKTGDKGETSLFGGKRVSKSSLRVEAYGTLDELNSAMGVVIAENQKSKIKNELIEVQRDLFQISGQLASIDAKYKILNTKYLQERVNHFETIIDQMTGELSELRSFILPGGGKVGSLLHFIRSICRRVERRIVQLSQKEKVDSSILVYFNRLSDLLFTMARFINYKEKQKEIIWKRD